MGIDTRCGIMVGLPYKELKEELDAMVDNLDVNIYDIDIDEMIDNGDLEIGSIYYDSDRKDNIVGLFIQTTSSYKELMEYDLQSAGAAAVKELENMIPTIMWKLYLVLDIT